MNLDFKEAFTFMFKDKKLVWKYLIFLIFQSILLACSYSSIIQTQHGRPASVESVLLELELELVGETVGSFLTLCFRFKSFIRIFNSEQSPR